MKGDLLWVYEGLTNYLGEVLAPRSGLWTPEDYRESLAETAAELDNKYGRTWRPLEDTAVAAQVLYDSGGDYQNLRRGVDYYPEGTLIWLDADVTDPPVEQGREVARRFLPSCSTAARAARRRSSRTNSTISSPRSTPCNLTTGPASSISACIPRRARAPLGGIEHSGWKLTYDDVRSDFWKAHEDTRKITDLSTPSVS